MGAFLILILMAAALLIVIPIAKRFHRNSSSAPNPIIYLVALIPAIFFFLCLQLSHQDGAIPLFFLVIIGAFGLAALWVRELVHLMGLSDDAFPGRHDKVMWFILLLCVPPIGVVAFGVFRRAYWPTHKPTLDAVARDLA